MTFVHATVRAVIDETDLTVPEDIATKVVESAPLTDYTSQVSYAFDGTGYMTAPVGVR